MNIEMSTETEKVQVEPFTDSALLERWNQLCAEIKKVHVKLVLAWRSKLGEHSKNLLKALQIIVCREVEGSQLLYEIVNYDPDLCSMSHFYEIDRQELISEDDLTNEKPEFDILLRWIALLKEWVSQEGFKTKDRMITLTAPYKCPYRSYGGQSGQASRGHSRTSSVTKVVAVDAGASSSTKTVTIGNATVTTITAARSTSATRAEASEKISQETSSG